MEAHRSASISCDVPLLARYRAKVSTYNDDIQGTAAVALAGIYAALRLSGQKLVDQRFLFLDGGLAATGIAEYIFDNKLARVEWPKDVAALIRSCVHRPVYLA
jgi:malic enzyme